MSIMRYEHPEDGEKACHCPVCGWHGTLHQTDEFTPAESQEPVQVCPRCTAEVPVLPGGEDEYQSGAW